MRILVLGPEPLRLGFMAAGAEFVAVTAPQEVLQHAIDAVAGRKAGVLLVATSVAAPIREDLDRLRMEHPLPPILEIPDLAGEAVARPDPLASVAAAFGIQV